MVLALAFTAVVLFGLVDDANAADGADGADGADVPTSADARVVGWNSFTDDTGDGGSNAAEAGVSVFLGDGCC